MKMKRYGEREWAKVMVMVVMVWVVVEGVPCTKNCGANGSCNSNTGTCSCSEGWGGDDCSLRMERLNGGDSLSGEAQTRSWVYYESFIPNNAITLSYYLQQINSGDCDFYVKVGSVPSKTVWDAKDTTIDKSITVTLPATPLATYYAGVYGYRDCAYVISLSITTGSICLNDCSGHGDCTLGTCICDASHYGADCSNQIYELTEGVMSFEGETYGAEWRYFFTRTVIESQPDHTLRYKPFYITFSQSDDSATTGNLLYIRANSIPTQFEYDFRNGIVVDGEINIGIGRPDDPLYYIAVYTSSSSTFTVSISYEGIQECAEQCSSHGSCIEDDLDCYCYDGYSGASCETMDDLMSDGEYYRGYVKNNVWNYYSFTSSTQSNVMVSLAQVGDQSTDCDLYIQADSLPTKTTYAYRDITAASNISLIVINPMGHNWYVGVYGTHLCDYQLSQTIEPRCPNDCSGNGVCYNQRCLCLSDWTGESCLYPYQGMTGVSSLYTGTIGPSFWHYFRYAVEEGVHVTSITVSLKEVSSTGFIHVYLQRGGLPTLTDFIDADVEQSTAIHSVYTVYTTGSRDFYIGVYGTSFIPLTQTFSYKLGVYSPRLTFEEGGEGEEMTSDDNVDDEYDDDVDDNVDIFG